LLVSKFAPLYVTIDAGAQTEQVVGRAATYNLFQGFSNADSPDKSTEIHHERDWTDQSQSRN
jgi:hypothetical protein